MRHITKQQLSAYILAQDDDKQVDMRNPFSEDGGSADRCGCVMVHYCQDKLSMSEFTVDEPAIRSCELESKDMIANMDKDALEFLRYLLRTKGATSVTYAELKNDMNGESNMSKQQAFDTIVHTAFKDGGCVILDIPNLNSSHMLMLTRMQKVIDKNNMDQWAAGFLRIARANKLSYKKDN